MSRATADVLDDLAPRAATEADVEPTPFDIEPEATVRLVGPSTRTAARSADGGAVLLGGEVARASVPTARTLVENGRAVPSDARGIVLEGHRRPAWVRGLAVLDAAEAARLTSGENFRTPAEHGLTGRDTPTLVGADELEGNLVTIKLADVTVTDTVGREYGPGAVIRGKATTLARYAARGRAVRIA